MEKTFVMVKPDGIKKGLVGEVIKRLEEKKLEIAKIETIKIPKRKCIELYKESLRNYPQIRKAFYDYMTKDPAIILLVEGKNAIKKARKIRGSTDPSKSPKGTIRGDFAGDQKMAELTKRGKATKNVMHASGDKKEAEFEIWLFFKNPRSQ